MRIFFLFLSTLLLGACAGSSSTPVQDSPVSQQQRVRERLPVAQRRQFDKFFLAALRQHHLGNFDAELELLDAALRIDPNASEALFTQAKLLLELQNNEDSLLRKRGEQQLLLAHQLEPHNTDYRTALAEHYVLTERYARAARVYEEMTEEHPKEEHLEILFRLYQQAKNYSAALSTLDRLEKIAGRNVENSLRRYSVYKAMGRPTQAYQAIWMLCEEHPTVAKYRLIMGDLYLDNGYPEAALSLYGDVLTSDSSNAGALSSMANYYYMVDSTELFHQQMTRIMCDSDFPNPEKRNLLEHYTKEAFSQRVDKKRLFQHFLEALRSPQTDGRLPYMAANFAYQAEFGPDSLILIGKIILRDDPTNEEIRLATIELLSKKHDTTQMWELSQEGLKLHPQQTLFYWFGSLVQTEFENVEAAYSLVKQGIATLDEDSDSLLAASFYYCLGDLEHQRKNQAKCFAAYEKVLQLAPDHVPTLNNYAYYLSLAKKDLKKALSLSSHLLELAPDEPTYLDTHAWVLYQMQRYPQARQYIDQCLELLDAERKTSSSSATLFEHAGDIHYRCGNIEQALSHWSTAKQMADDPNVQQRLQRKIRRKRP